MRPFRAYNEFALAYGCDLSGTKPVWSPKTFSLGALELELHGITSPWISDAEDRHDVERQRLVVGAFQAAKLHSELNSVSVALCHHPARWLRDAAELAPWLASAQLVLTGHEHEAGIELSSDGRTLFVASGAVNPSRGLAGWIPAYNVIEVSMQQSASSLDVVIHSRSWQRDHAEFGVDETRPDPFRSTLTLGATSPTLQTQSPARVEPEISLEAEPFASSRRSSVHLIMRAPPDRRLLVARELGLLSDGLGGLEADRAILKNAVETNQLAELAARLAGGL
jgi:hypothetical protein